MSLYYLIVMITLARATKLNKVKQLTNADGSGQM